VSSATVGFTIGLGAFCAPGFVIGHHLPGVGIAVTIAAALLVV